MTWEITSVLIPAIGGIIAIVWKIVGTKDETKIDPEDVIQIRISIGKMQRDIENLKEVLNRFKNDVAGDIKEINSNILMILHNKPRRKKNGTND